MRLATTASQWSDAILFSCRLAGGAGRIAASLTTIDPALFAIETVSLHESTSCTINRLPRSLLIGWMWAIAASLGSSALTRLCHSTMGVKCDQNPLQQH